MTPGMPQMDPIQVPHGVTFKCPDCQEDVNAILQRPMLHNAPQCAVIVITHETPDTCPKCGAKFMMKIVGISPQFQLQIVWVKLQTKESTLVAGTEESLQKTLAQMRTIGDITGRKQ